MAVRAVVVDIGGVLEITPRLGTTAMWEEKLGLAAGDIDGRLHEVWRDGSVGAISAADVQVRIGSLLAVDAATVDAFLADIWTEYLGTLNTELTGYVRGLRPRVYELTCARLGVKGVVFRDNTQAIADIEALLAG